MVKRANISLSNEIMDRIDDRAEEMGLNRSAFITVAVNNYFLQEDSMRAMKEMPEFMRKMEEIERRISSNELEG